MEIEVIPSLCVANLVWYDVPMYDGIYTQRQQAIGDERLKLGMRYSHEVWENSELFYNISLGPAGLFNHTHTNYS
jgi:hypothetical protein